MHLVMNNYTTQKTPKIKTRLARRPRWHVHFTPTSASWINQVEGWFAELRRKQLQRGVHRSIAELEADIATSIDAHNENPKPYRWVKSAEEILPSRHDLHCAIMLAVGNLLRLQLVGRGIPSAQLRLSFVDVWGPTALSLAPDRSPKPMVLRPSDPARNCVVSLLALHG